MPWPHPRPAKSEGRKGLFSALQVILIHSHGWEQPAFINELPWENQEGLVCSFCLQGPPIPCPQISTGTHPAGCPQFWIPQLFSSPENIFPSLASPSSILLQQHLFFLTFNSLGQTSTNTFCGKLYWEIPQNAAPAPPTTWEVEIAEGKVKSNHRFDLGPLLLF